MIIIKEQDNTSQASTEYSNFTVVVPGMVANGYDTKTLFQSVADAYGIYECSNTADFRTYVGIIEKDVEDAVSPSVTHDNITTKADYDTWAAVSNIYSVIPNEDGDVGYLRTALYKYVKSSKFVTGNTYVAINTGDEGKDAVSSIGNQYAYELLRLGYTVLYKKYTQESELETNDFWEPLKDKAVYDFRYITSGGFISKTVNQKMIEVAQFVKLSTDTSVENGRGDCWALLDIAQSTYKGMQQKTAIANIITDINGYVSGTTDTDAKLTYAEFTVPYVNYSDYTADTNTDYSNSCFPGSFHYLMCAANAFFTLGYNEWFAVAGETRGKGVYTIDAPDCILGEAALKSLMPRYMTDDGIKCAVNAVIKTRKGYLLWGNRTAKVLPKYVGTSATAKQEDLKASHFLNVRQLCCTLKKQIYIACRRFSFDPNSDILWNNFCSAVRPILEKMKAYEGITDYEFVKLVSNEKATLKALIRIVPVEAVEDFKIGVTLEDSLTGSVDVSFIEE